MESISQLHADGNSLSDLDFSILKLLQEDGRISFTEIAKKLNVSISNVRTRVTRLIEDKTIQIIGRVNTEKIGFHSYVQIKICIRPAKVIQQVVDQLLKLKEASFIAITSGEFDIEVDLMCRDNDHLLHVLNEEIAKIEGIDYTRTNMYLKVLKYAQPDLNLVYKEAVNTYELT